MSSTNKTEKIGLSQWESTDPVSVEDFNRDFRLLDGLIGGMLDGLHLEQLDDVTVAAPNKSNFTVDVSGIDFGKYFIVIVDYVSIQKAQMQINKLSANALTLTKGSKHVLFTMKDPEACAALLSVDETVAGKTCSIKNSRISSFYFDAPSFSSEKFTTDSHIKIWGIW